MLSKLLSVSSPDEVERLTSAQEYNDQHTEECYDQTIDQINTDAEEFEEERISHHNGGNDSGGICRSLLLPPHCLPSSSSSLRHHTRSVLVLLIVLLILALLSLVFVMVGVVVPFTAVRSFMNGTCVPSMLVIEDGKTCICGSGCSAKYRCLTIKVTYKDSRQRWHNATVYEDETTMGKEVRKQIVYH